MVWYILYFNNKDYISYFFFTFGIIINHQYYVLKKTNSTTTTIIPISSQLFLSKFPNQIPDSFFFFFIFSYFSSYS